MRRECAPPLPAISRRRLDALSDGIFSILLTLLVLDLKLPSEHSASDARLLGDLVALVPKVLAWILSFSLGALFWVAQHHFYERVATVSAGLLRLELATLGLLSLLPFTTAAMGEHGAHRAAAALYSAHLMIIAGLCWWRAAFLERRPSLQLAGTPSESFRGMRSRMRIFMGCATAAFFLAFVAPGWNMLALLPAVAVRLRSHG